MRGLSSFTEEIKYLEKWLALTKLVNLKQKPRILILNSKFILILSWCPRHLNLEEKPNDSFAALRNV